MPDGKYVVYLHTDDRADVCALKVLDLPRQLRSVLITQSVISGTVLWQVDARLPELLAAVFDGQLTARQLMLCVALLDGRSVSTPAEPVSSGATELPANYERRRVNVTIPEGGNGRLAQAVTERIPGRVRSQFLRTLLVAGCALHTLDARLPRQLESLPDGALTAGELLQLVARMTGVATEPVPAAPADAGGDTVPAPGMPPSVPEQSQIIRNMKKMFG